MAFRRSLPLRSSIAAVSVMLAAYPFTVTADSVSALAVLNEGTMVFDNKSSTGSPLTAQRVGSLGAASVSSALGWIHVDVDSSSTPFISVYTNAGANWTESYTIFSSTGPQTGGGVANFTFEVEGTLSGGNMGVGNKVEYTLALPIGQVVADGYFDKDGGPWGPLPGGTYTVQVPFSYGQAFDVSASLGAIANPGSGTAFGHAHITLRQTGFTVAGGNYTSVAASGSSKGGTFAANDSYSNFSLANAVGHHSTVSLLDGTAGGARDLSFSFVAADPTIASLSDVVDLKGANGDLLVLQMQYDEAAVIAQFGSEAGLELSWFNTATQSWENAVNGNSATTSTRIDRAYNPLTDHVLGNWGQDAETNTVWAVIDHNSEFTVTAPQSVPEPMSTALIGLGGLLIAARRRRVAQSRGLRPVSA